MPLIGLAVASTTAPETTSIEPGATKVLLFIRSLSSTLDAAEPLAAANAALESAEKAGAARLLAEHVAGWSAMWDEGTVEVEGDPELAAAIDGSLYSILSSARADFPYGLSPGGLASDGYHGHVFWDQESWMWPPLNHLHPAIAGSLLSYRFAKTSLVDRRAAAAENARSYGLPGVMYPWESTLTGVPADTWQLFGPSGSSCETYEIHIGGDIAQALWRYHASTGNTSWLCDGGGLETLRGIATYYSARVSAGAAAGTYELRRVTGPDEQAPEVNNSCYVNSIASLTLRAAANLSAVCGQPVPANWTLIAAALSESMPFNASGHFNLEYDGYRHGTQVKQADTIMAFGYPLSEWRDALAPSEVDPVAILNDLTYYEGVTNPGGPAMTWSLFSMGWLDRGGTDKALSLFRRGYANAQKPFQVWTEGADGTGCTTFLTGAGGFLQSVINGYLGVRLGSGSLRLRPVAPPGNATRLAIRGLHWHGRRLRLETAAGGATLQLLWRARAASVQRQP